MRSRNVKPGLFKNDTLAELPMEWRYLFVGLWTLADREGRLEFRPKRIKGELFPFDDVNVSAAVDALCARGFLVQYPEAGRVLLQVTNWHKHQRPHHREAASALPAPPCTNDAPTMDDACTDREGEPRHGLAALIPDSLIPDPLIPKSKSRSKSNAPAAQIELPEWLPADLWERWGRYREKLGKGFTDDAQRLSLRTLDKLRSLGHPPVGVIEQSIERGYRGLFAIKGDDDARHGTRTRGQGVADRTIGHARRHGIV